MIVLEFTLITFLIVCAIAFAFSKRLLTSVIIFMSYSLIMSIIWFIMESPDLAITEAAVGAGVTSVLLFLTLKKVNVLKGKKDEVTQIKTNHKSPTLIQKHLGIRL